MNKRRPTAPKPRRADIVKGATAELAFRRWLDASVLPHLYVEQSPITVPVPLRGQIKRPDYIVGIPGVGLVAFDVKAKTPHEGQLIFELTEVRKLQAFARLFHLTVYFACLDPEGGDRGHWIRLDQLQDAESGFRAGSRVLLYPLERATPVTLAENFYTAFVRAVTLATQPTVS